MCIRDSLGNAGQPPVIKGAADILELFERIKKENEKTADGEQGTCLLYTSRCV